MARKWQEMVAIRRRRISFSRSNVGLDPSVTTKGHFVVYTTNKRRFMVPLEYLNSNIFRELLRMAEEEFGLPGDGPIRLPCDAAFLEYVVLLVRGCISKDLEEALFTSMATCHCSASFSLALGPSNQQTLIHGF